MTAFREMKLVEMPKDETKSIAEQMHDMAEAAAPDVFKDYERVLEHIKGAAAKNFFKCEFRASRESNWSVRRYNAVAVLLNNNGFSAKVDFTTEDTIRQLTVDWENPKPPTKPTPAPTVPAKKPWWRFWS